MPCTTTALASCMTLIIHITSSGGFAGLAASGMDKRVVVDTLTEPTRDEVCATFAPERLAALQNETAAPGRADTVAYSIRVTGDDGASQSYTIDETILPADMLDLIDALD